MVKGLKACDRAEDVGTTWRLFTTQAEVQLLFL